MDIKLTDGPLHTLEADAVIVSIYEGSDLPEAAAGIDAALGGAVRDLITSGDLTGKVSQVGVLYPRGAIPARRVIVVGLGKREDVTADVVRRASASAAQRARDLKSKSVVSALHGTLAVESGAQAVVEGTLLGLYTYHGQKTSAPNNTPPESFTLARPGDADPAAVQRGMDTGRAMAEGSALARTLTNLPPNICTPAYLAETAQQIAAQHGMRIEVLDVPQMEALNMGALLGVARGSKTPPKFIILEHNADQAGQVPALVLVGKGITFDTGGYSIKTAEGMVSMKGDMAGAAAVLGAMQIVGALSAPLHVVGLIPATFNMISGEAYLPSEVLTASNGMTIEIISTDAEGRLVLADALVYAGRYKPAAVVDIATLTGSITVALGNIAAGLFSTDDGLRDSLMAAGAATSERLWPMPMFQEYDKLIESKTADTKNSAGQRLAGASVGAIFLKKFTSYPAWAHIDMAGMMADAPENPTIPGGGATGFGARLLAEFVRTWRA